MVTQLPLLDLRTTPATRRSTRSMPRTRRSAPALTPERAAHADASPDWRLDEHTREIGLRGVAEARRALAAAIERVGAAA